LVGFLVGDVFAHFWLADQRMNAKSATAARFQPDQPDQKRHEAKYDRPKRKDQVGDLSLRGVSRQRLVALGQPLLKLRVFSRAGQAAFAVIVDAGVNLLFAFLFR